MTIGRMAQVGKCGTVMGCALDKMSCKMALVIDFWRITSCNLRNLGKIYGGGEPIRKDTVYMHSRGTR